MKRDNNVLRKDSSMSKKSNIYNNNSTNKRNSLKIDLVGSKQNPKNLIIDKLNLTKYSRAASNNTRNQPNKQEQQQSLKELVEYKNINYKAISLIDGCLEMLQDNKVENIEDTEKYEMVDKAILEKVTNENQRLKLLKLELRSQYNELCKNYNKFASKLNGLSSSFSSHAVTKEKNSNAIYNQSIELRELYIQIHKVNDMINKVEIEKENIFRALVKMANNSNVKLPKELRDIYKKYNNDYYGSTNKADFSQKISTLRENLSKLEKELEEKTNLVDKYKSILNLSS